MALPIDLVLVRHGQSEGNAAKRLSEKGDHTVYTPEFLERHSASFRLTDCGRDQARKAGQQLRELFWPGGFDRYITSEYIRAMETAGYLDLPEVKWFCDPYLAERDWGKLDLLPENKREEKFGDVLRRRKIEPFFWRAPNGESFVDLCLRIDRVIETLHRECSDKRVLIVCHGEVMRAFQVRIERLSQVRFKELIFSPNEDEHIHNCQITHYTRRDSETGKLLPYVASVRHIRPTWQSGWLKIERPRYSSKDLLEVVSKTEAMIR